MAKNITMIKCEFKATDGQIIKIEQPTFDRNYDDEETAMIFVTNKKSKADGYFELNVHKDDDGEPTNEGYVCEYPDTDATDPTNIIKGVTVEYEYGITIKKIDLWLNKPIEIEGYGEVIHIDTTTEGDEYIEREPKRKGFNDILFFSEMQDDEEYDKAMLTIERLMGYTNVEGFDLYKLNKMFAHLLHKHENDTDVQGESRESFESIKADTMSDPNFSDEDKESMVSYHAAIWNAWDEMCDKFKGLRESNLNWFAGAEFTEFASNEFDAYIGTGEEF